jgi:hypothetical protein
MPMLPEYSAPGSSVAWRSLQTERNEIAVPGYTITVSADRVSRNSAHLAG